MKNKIQLFWLSVISFSIFISCEHKSENQFANENIIPWCIVAFDALERSPQARMEMLKNQGFNKYAYDWRDNHLDEMADEIALARDYNIDISSVWLWLNADRDTVGNISPANHRIFEILESTDLKTTIWMSFSDNYFEGLDHNQSLAKAVEMTAYICEKANALDCDVGLYNHMGWFGEPKNQVEIIKTLPQHKISIVYNFHHGHHHINNFQEIAETMTPYLSVVNLNGMKEGGPKILDIGKGDHEKEMIEVLVQEGFNGPWGILGHIEDEDIEKVMNRNYQGLINL